MIKIRLLGYSNIDLEDSNFLEWRGVSLEKLTNYTTYPLNKKVVDIVVGIDGMRPILEADTGTEMLGIPDIYVANRGFSFITSRFDNQNNVDMFEEIELNKWLLCPYKFFTLWHPVDDNLYQLSHDSEVGLIIINPPLTTIGGIDMKIPATEVACVPVKAQQMGSVEHIFGENANRRYTIEIKSIRKFKYSEVYN